MLFKSMSNKKAKVIFFIDGPVPSDADRDAADKLASTRQQVVFRNAQAIACGESLERCDFVAGHIPAEYAALPRIESPAAVIPPPPVEEAPAPVMPAQEEAPAPTVATESPADEPAPAPKAGKGKRR